MLVFILKNLIGNFSQTNTSSNVQNIIIHLEPTPEFKEFFLEPNLVSLLFNCYELVRDDSDIAHTLMQSIIQLSTLSGPIFKDEDSEMAMGNTVIESKSRVKFLNNYLQRFLETFTK